MDAVDHEAHERRIAQALHDLIHQVDISEYRDELGHPMKNNMAFLRAQALADEFRVSHEDICAALDKCDGAEVADAARWLHGRATEASPTDKPVDYQVWGSGP